MLESNFSSSARPYLVVTPLSKLTKIINIHQPQDVLTLMNPGLSVLSPSVLSKKRHLSVYFNDINESRSQLIAPNKKHVIAIIDFVLSWKKMAPLLIHCSMGISRSSAAAFIALCVLNPGMDEEKLARYLRFKSPIATPNNLLVSIADQLLFRHGRMVTAINYIGRGSDAYEGIPFILRT